MTTKPDIASPLERELTRRFALLRQQDAALVPDSPDAARLAQRTPLVVSSRFYAAVPMMAAALAAVLITGALLTDPSSPDPGVLYASIMRENIIATDQLLSISAGTMPAMTSTLAIEVFDPVAIAYPQAD